MFSISNDELEKKDYIGSTTECRNCGKIHKVKYGDKINEDGTREKSKLLAYVKCPDNNESYLVAVNGKKL